MNKILSIINYTSLNETKNICVKAYVEEVVYFVKQR